MQSSFRLSEGHTEPPPGMVAAIASGARGNPPPAGEVRVGMVANALTSHSDCRFAGRELRPLVLARTVGANQGTPTSSPGPRLLRVDAREGAESADGFGCTGGTV